MEVKPGYKQTEVGVLPEEWEVTPFVSLGSVIDGDRGVNYPGGKDFNIDGHCLFLNAGNVTKAGFKFGDCAFISREKDERLSKGKLKRDDIVLTTRGTVGNFAHFGSAVSFEHIRINSGMVILRNGSADLDTAFLYALFQSHFVETQIERLTFGSAQPQLTVKGINEFRIVVPLLTEQRAIATALSDADALIGALDQLIAKKRDIKQAAMQQLLTGKTRLSGFHGEWEVKRLGDVAEMGSGGTPPSSVPAYYDGDIPWVSISDMTKGGKVIRTTDRNLTRAGFANSAAQMFPAGTILYAMYASLGECSIAGISLCSSQAILGIRPKDTLSGEFLYYFLTSLKAIVKTLGQQGTQANLNKGMVQDFRLSLPPIPEQIVIAEVLSDMDAELAVLGQRRDKTRALKQGMMQELLTGRTRLV